MVKAESILGIGALALIGLYAVNRFSGNAEERQTGKSIRTATRQDEITQRVDSRQEEKTKRTEARQETLQNVVKTVGSVIGSGKSIRKKSSSRSVSIQPQTITKTTTSNNSPFIPSSSGASNISLLSGGTGKAESPKVTVIEQGSSTKSKKLKSKIKDFVKDFAMPIPRLTSKVLRRA